MSTNVPLVIIGLTGGIASGKSTVSAILREYGANVIDADQVSREVVEPGQPALDEICEAFGASVLDKHGYLDRASLAKRIFDDERERHKLNAIMHPRIGQAMIEKALAARQQGHIWSIYDAALIVENNLHPLLDSLIVVAASPEVQIQRLITRDGLSYEDARARIDVQLPLEDKLAVADYVVDNNGSLDETRQQVQALYQRINQNVLTRGTAKPTASFHDK